ncbi:hypothetical protein FRB98_006006 [Tulasnella sp. 332]|nr:hypothetical protein FRB98_006006 [Tulasnella sp. 332]
MSSRALIKASHRSTLALKRAGAGGPCRFASHGANGPAARGSNNIMAVGAAALGFGGVYYFLMRAKPKDNTKVGSHEHPMGAGASTMAAVGKSQGSSGDPSDVSSSIQRALATDAPGQAFATEKGQGRATSASDETASIQQAMNTDAPKTAYNAEKKLAPGDQGSTMQALNADAPQRAYQHEKGLAK